MKYRDNMTSEEIETLMRDVEELDRAYQESKVFHGEDVFDSDDLEDWTKKEYHTMRP